MAGSRGRRHAGGMELRHDTVLITGGTSGIGLEMAEQLSTAGNTVLVTGRDQDRLRQLRTSHPQLHSYQVEVTELASGEALHHRVVADFPDLNVLINNAGLMQNISFREAPATGIADEITVNLAGPILVTQVFLRHLLAQPAAAVLNVTSGIAYFAFDKAPVYSASKLGLHSYTQTLRTQLRGTSVEVFEPAPSLTTKPMFNGSEAENREVDRIPKMPVPEVVSAEQVGILVRGLRRVASLRCEEETTAYLFTLVADTPRPRRGRRAAETVPHGIATLVAGLALPAFVEGRTLDVLAANPPATALSPRLRPGGNRLRDVFLDPAERAMFTDWDLATRALVAGFRHSLGTGIHDEQVAELVGGLSLASPQFCELWARHDIRPLQSNTLTVIHPQVGEITLKQEKLFIPTAGTMRLVILHPEPGSPAADALTLLSATIPETSTAR